RAVTELDGQAADDQPIAEREAGHRPGRLPTRICLPDENVATRLPTGRRVASTYETVSDAELGRIASLLVRFFGAVNTLNCAMPKAAPSLSPHQVRVVMTLVKQPGRTISELAEAVGISLGWASRVVEVLEATGHVQRERDPDDRRVVRVSLTPAVQAIAESTF